MKKTQNTNQTAVAPKPESRTNMSMNKESLTENDLIQDGAAYPELTANLVSLWRQGKINARREANGRIRYTAIFCTYPIDDKGTACGKPCDLSYTYQGEPLCTDCFEILCEADDKPCEVCGYNPEFCTCEETK